jgi:hypothetical protein
LDTEAVSDDILIFSGATFEASTGVMVTTGVFGVAALLGFDAAAGAMLFFDLAADFEIARAAVALDDAVCRGFDGVPAADFTDFTLEMVVPRGSDCTEFLGAAGSLAAGGFGLGAGCGGVFLKRNDSNLMRPSSERF